MGFFERLPGGPQPRTASWPTSSPRPRSSACIRGDRRFARCLHDGSGKYYANHQFGWGRAEWELCFAAFRGDGEFFGGCGWFERARDVSGCERVYGGADYVGDVDDAGVVARGSWIEGSGGGCGWGVSARFGEQRLRDRRCGAGDEGCGRRWVWDRAAEL